MNLAIITGYVGQDPEVSRSQNGTAMARLSVATTKKWKDKNTGQLQEKTSWHRLKLFGRNAEIAEQYVKKGSLVSIQGELDYGQYTDKQGIERYTTDVVVNVLKLLGGVNQQQNQGGNFGQQNNSQPRQNQGFNQPNQDFNNNTADFDSFSDDVPF